MEIISGIKEYQMKIAEEESFLFFVKTDNCSVCEGLRPQVEAMESDFKLPFYLADASKIAELAGQLMLFTAPVVLLFRQGREIHRFARFVPIDELRHRLDELEESLNV